MKFCSRFYDYLYLDHYDGDVWLCQWMNHEKGCIGNILQDQIEDIYNSEHTEMLRQSMHDQSFRYCRMEACPNLQNNDLPEVSSEEYWELVNSKGNPTTINLAYDFVCNQSCETCRSSVFKPTKDYADKMTNIHEKILPYLNKAKRITASGHGDPFASKYMMDVLANLHPTNSDLSILLETNGVFFDEEHWERIKHLSDFHLEIVVTINSFDEFTYRHISRGGNYSKLMQNLKFMSQLRDEGKISILVNSFVIQDRNFREIPSFIKKSLEEYSFDRVVLKPVYQWGTMDEQVYWFKDVLNPMHPYHEEYLEIIQDPIMKTNKVYNFGGDTVHPARPYPESTSDPIVPYTKIEKGSKVVVYGAGQIGSAMVKRLNKNRYCDVVLWVDKCFDGIHTQSPNALLNMDFEEYDYVIIATTNLAYMIEIKENVKSMDIPENKIITCV